MVLEHVKTHYRDDGSPQEANKQQQQQQSQQSQAIHTLELGPPPPVPIQMPFQIMSSLLNGHTAGTANVHNRNLSITLGGGSGGVVGNQANNQNASNTHQTLNFNPQNTLLTPASALDVSKINNGMPETNSANTNSNNSLKGSFRCGHCGQISNWKHVIQVYTNQLSLSLSLCCDSLSLSFCI